jgi:3-phenylpropionate/cinnamic acid dioxygenase small subunit
MLAVTEGAVPVAYGSPVYDEVVDFVYREAECLDERRHRDWLAMLTDDIRYRIPVRVTSAHSLDDSVREDMAHLDEDAYSLRKRVERFETSHAWAEDPPSRTRRHVGNVRAWEGRGDGGLIVRTNLLLFRSRGDIHAPDLISAGRTDLLRRTPDGLRLAEREVLLDESVVRMQNFAVFL